MVVSTHQDSQVMSGRCCPDSMGSWAPPDDHHGTFETGVGDRLIPSQDGLTERDASKDKPGRGITVKPLDPAAIPCQAAMARQATDGGQSFGDCNSYACGRTRMQPLSHEGDHANQAQPADAWILAGPALTTHPAIACCKTRTLAGAIAGSRTGSHWPKEPRGLGEEERTRRKIHRGGSAPSRSNHKVRALVLGPGVESCRARGGQIFPHPVSPGQNV